MLLFDFTQEPLKADRHCLEMYKVAKEHQLPLPCAHAHVYLAGIVDRKDNPKLSDLYERYRVKSPEELQAIVKLSRKDSQPNAMPYLYSIYSADHYASQYAQDMKREYMALTLECFRTAGKYSARLGDRPRSQLFHILADGLDSHLALLACFYEERKTKIEITEEDYQSFKEYMTRLGYLANTLGPLTFKLDIVDKFS